MSGPPEGERESMQTEGTPSIRCVFHDRATVERGLRVREPYVLISIRDPRRQVKPAYDGLCRGVLKVAFHDAEPTAGLTLPAGVRVMTPLMARRIVAFVRGRPADVSLVVVHCEQGASRSPAVAAALLDAFGGDGAAIFRQLTPNQHVYELVLAAAHRSGDGNAAGRL